MLNNNKQIAICLIIDKHIENGLKLLEQLREAFYADQIVIISNSTNLNIKKDYLKINYIENNQFGNIIRTKNKALKYCYQRNFDYIFLITDNIVIKDITVFLKYTSTSAKNNLNFISFNNSPIYNLKQVDIHNKLNDDFILVTNQTVKFVGFFNQSLNENDYLEDYYIRLINKEAIVPCFTSFPDIQNSNNYLELVEQKNRQVDWNQLVQKYRIKDKQNYIKFNDQIIETYYSYKEITKSIKDKKEYKTIACLIAKNENQYLDEWIQYYYQLGFDRIIIYENNCKIKLKYFYPYVNIIEWNMQKKQQQQRAYMHCLREFGNDVDFISFFDADEFLYIKNGVSLQQFLRQYSDCFGIAINWRLFGDNGLKSVENNNYQVLTRFTKCDKNLAEQVKLILNCQLIKAMSNFNDVIFHSSHYINYPVSLTDKTYQLGPLNKRIENSDLYTAEVYHYSIKTIEEFLNFKAFRGRADIVVDDDTYKINQYFEKQNKNDIQNLNLVHALDRNTNNHYAEFNLVDGTQEYIKFEHINRFKFQNLILNILKIKSVKQIDKKPLVTISILPPKDIENWQYKLLSDDRPYINYTKFEDGKIYFHIQIVRQNEEELYKFNCIFAFMWKMLFTSIMLTKDMLVLHGILLKNGNIIVGTSGCGKTTLAQRLSIDDGSIVICDDNVLITWEGDKLIAQPLPMLPYIKEGREFKWTTVNFNQQYEVKDIFILTKDSEEKVVQINKDYWNKLLFYSCLVLINQPFAQRNEVYNTYFDKWIDCREGLSKICQDRIKELVNKIDRKPLIITTNTKDITKNINKQLKDSLSLS